MALGKNAIVSGLIAGALAGLIGSLIAGVATDGTNKFAPAVFLVCVATVLGGVVTSWQNFMGGNALAGIRKLSLGLVVGAVAGVVALVPADSVARELVPDAVLVANGFHCETIEGSSSDAVERIIDELPPEGCTASQRNLGVTVAVWAITASLIGLLVGLIRSVRSSMAGLMGGLIGGAAGGLLHGSTTARYRNRGLEISGLSPATLLITASVAAIVGLSIGAASRALRKADLTVIEGRLKGQEILIESSRATIGSGPRNTLVLAGDDVRQLHVELDLSGSMATVRALQPIMIDGTEVSGEAGLPDGAVMRIGSSYVRFRLRGQQ